jgi:hypothetical protein
MPSRRRKGQNEKATNATSLPAMGSSESQHKAKLQCKPYWGPSTQAEVFQGLSPAGHVCCGTVEAVTHLPRVS